MQVICKKYRILFVETRKELTELIKKRLKNIIEGDKRITKNS